jgi:hypothetical protein
MGILSNIFGATEKKAIPNKIITLDKLEQMFESMKKTPEIDLKKPLLWGYFFTHSEPTMLEKTKLILIKKGYRSVDIYLSDKESPTDPNVYWLHVEKEEIHSAASLDKLNDEFYLLANKLGLKSYDGMDVGPIKPLKPKMENKAQ